MNKSEELPKFDDKGVNLSDPHDKLGFKTKYISLVQEKALRKYIPKNSGSALDIGCGYGRMSSIIASLGFEVTGVEPSERVLNFAKKIFPEHQWFTGELPDLPVEKKAFDLVCLLSVARVLHLMDILDVTKTIPNYVKPGGKILIIDNIKEGDKRYIPESWFFNAFQDSGFYLSNKIPIRASRWPLIYMIRYGIVPECWFNAIAEWELNRMQKKKKAPKLSYHNYLFIYEKK